MYEQCICFAHLFLPIHQNNWESQFHIEIAEAIQYTFVPKDDFSSEYKRADKRFKWKPGYWFENFGTPIEPNHRICHKNGYTVQMVLDLRDTCKSYPDTDPKRPLAL